MHTREPECIHGPAHAAPRHREPPGSPAKRIGGSHGRRELDVLPVLERLIGWCDDSGIWDIAMERHPGGEHALVRSADPYTAFRHAHHIDPDSMAGFAGGIDPTTWNARQAAARLRRRHDFTGEADMILKAKGL